MKCLPGTNRVDRCLRIRVDNFWEGAFLRNDDARQIWHFCPSEKSIPGESGNELLQILNRHWIVNRVEVALLRLGPTDLSDFGLEIDDVLSVFVNIRPVQQFQNCCHITLKSGLLRS